MKTKIAKVIAANLRKFREAVGMTQQQIADVLGISFQQVQKYEKGINRISADSLFVVSEALGVPVEFFYVDGVDADEVLRKYDTAELVDQSVIRGLVRMSALTTSQRSSVDGAITSMLQSNHGVLVH